jgi:predicted alpha/beta superfamily hydrolase
MTTNKWESKIPTTPKNKNTKRCYKIWTRYLKSFRTGGKVVWLTDAQLTFARIKYSNKDFEPVLERDRLEEYKKYLDATID